MIHLADRSGLENSTIGGIKEFVSSWNKWLGMGAHRMGYIRIAEKTAEGSRHEGEAMGIMLEATWKKETSRGNGREENTKQIQ